MDLLLGLVVTLPCHSLQTDTQIHWLEPWESQSLCHSLSLELSEHLRYHSIHFMPVWKTGKAFSSVCWRFIIWHFSTFPPSATSPSAWAPGQGQNSLLQDEWQPIPQLFDPDCELLGWTKERGFQLTFISFLLLLSQLVN